MAGVRNWSSRVGRAKEWAGRAKWWECAEEGSARGSTPAPRLRSVGEGRRWVVAPWIQRSHARSTRLRVPRFCRIYLGFYGHEEGN